MKMTRKRQEEQPEEKDLQFQKISLLSSTMRHWENHQKKGYDPNETRISDLLECWSGESGPAIGLLGIPFDSAVLGRKGAKGGPKKIRDSIRYFKAYDWRRDFWFGDKKIYDFGDIIFDAQSVLECHNHITEIITKIVAKNFTVITLGGDHSITYPLVKGMKEHYREPIGLINIDAHLDVREVINGRISSGTPFRRLLEKNVIAGKNFVELGIRNFANAKKYRQYAEKQGATIFTVEEIQIMGLESVLATTLENITAETEFTYISLDLDSLDQIFAPGVSAPTPAGLTPTQIAQIIRKVVSETNTIGMDIVELNPIYDTADTTAINAALFLVEFCASHFYKHS
ncbi:formimidoylglutamase [Candidatus Heimdallarchaeota archaeon]|nr:MAG: formimidoylglutamase [Candidatus Gerdarchaeota archaeon]RLI73311.1 MAG: formimidoylglutamase [Candidatus Heimdallarchaeota archaeon]